MTYCSTVLTISTALLSLKTSPRDSVYSTAAASREKSQVKVMKVNLFVILFCGCFNISYISKRLKKNLTQFLFVYEKKRYNIHLLIIQSSACLLYGSFKFDTISYFEITPFMCPFANIHPHVIFTIFYSHF